jgi:hypothetical protein
MGKVPHGATFDVLLPLWPVFMSYVPHQLRSESVINDIQGYLHA